jgi:nitrate reductase delta subunit
MLRFKAAYRRARFAPTDAELPDYLPLVLEFAALAPDGAGDTLLREHRPSLELLRSGLHDAGSPYAHVLDALAAHLPALSVAERGAVARLAREGPPDEAVGLEPYGPPEAMPTGAHA